MPHFRSYAESVAPVAAVADRRLFVHPCRGVGDRGERAWVGPAQVDVERHGEEVVCFVHADEAVEVGRLFCFGVFFFEIERRHEGGVWR